MHPGLEHPTGGCPGVGMPKKELVRLVGAPQASFRCCLSNPISDLLRCDVLNRPHGDILEHLVLDRTNQKDGVTTV